MTFHWMTIIDIVSLSLDEPKLEVVFFNEDEQM